ncbi:abortive infection protein-like protein [Salinisphaera sp. PC39]|uniref:JDVT-CTERM system glutamic-type intramembrane protease MrtJ n=1 Tax=Salinisphaera sp. PC39 TaxID=1304156 RepID=UPI00334147D9
MRDTGSTGHDTRWASALGLLPFGRPRFDRHLAVALACAPLFWLALRTLPVSPPLPAAREIDAVLVFSLVLWYPLVEEVAFRGGLQGWLRGHAVARRGLGGVSLANILTSLAFVAWHGLYQGGGAALLVFVPSLIFGYFRDRYGTIYAALCLHAWYNATFLLAVSFRP